MGDVLQGIGFVFLLEGISYALFPDAMKRMMVQVMALPAETLRHLGLIFAIFGFLIIVLLKP